VELEPPDCDWLEPPPLPLALGDAVVPVLVGVVVVFFVVPGLDDVFLGVVVVVVGCCCC
jgi:hypothetical protein